MYSKHVCIQKPINGVRSFSHSWWYINTGLKNTYGKHNETWIPKNTFTQPRLSHFKTVSFKIACRFLETPCSFQFTVLKTASCFFSRYGQVSYIDERHRHRYEVGFSFNVSWSKWMYLSVAMMWIRLFLFDDVRWIQK